jgi:site-specific DNA recombinase
MIMKIALYARVSTNRQMQSQSIEQQIERLQEAVVQNPNWELAPEHVYRDDGYSGAKLNRPGLDRLRDAASMAAFELVLVTAPDRLARKYVHQVLLIEEMKKLGCDIQFLERPMQENDPHDQLLLQIRGAVAEYERSLIADRMRRGRQAKLRAGSLLPWTRAPYGYILDPERPRDPGRVRIDPVKANIVRQIFAWYTDPETSVSIHWVVKQLNDQQIPTPRGGKRWNPSTVRGILHSSTYIGMAYSGRTRPVPARRRKSALLPIGRGQSIRPTPTEEWIEVSVPGIIDQDIFDAAQSRLEKNQNMARRNNKSHDYLLRGLVSCGQCHLSSTGRSQGKYHYYKCRGRTDVHRAAKGERCTARYVPSQALDQLVWQDLCCIVAEPDLITHELERAQAGEWLPQALQAKRNAICQALASLGRQQERLLEVYLAEIILREEFERKRQELTQTQNGLRQQLRQLEYQAQKQIETLTLANNIQEFCKRIQPTLDNLDFEQRRKLVELLIDRVIVDDEKVEIRYVIPTGPNGETTRFCNLRTDYLNPHSATIKSQRHSLVGQIGGQTLGIFLADFPMHQQVDRVDFLGGQTTSSQPNALTGLLDITAERLPTTAFIKPDPRIPFLAQNIEPMPLIQLAQDRHRAKFTVSDQKYGCSARDQPTDIGQQSQLLPGGAVSFDTFDPGPGDWDRPLSVRQANDQQLMSEADLGAIHDQADFSQMAKLSFQPLPSDRCVPFSHSYGRVIQQPAQAPSGAQQFGWTGYLPGNTTQAYRPALITPNNQPDKVANLSDALVGSQFSNPLKPGMIHTVDRHVATSGKDFYRKNDFTRFCPADQLFCC